MENVDLFSEPSDMSVDTPTRNFLLNLTRVELLKFNLLMNNAGKFYDGEKISFYHATWQQ